MDSSGRRAPVPAPSASGEDEPPDEWIIKYLNGTELPVDEDPSGQQFTIAPLPNSFSGRSLDWFTFAEIFYASVYGSRDIMREALRQELDLIQIGKDATGFKRSALSIRTYLFELSRIGESSSTDLIAKLCQKLKQSDLLVWNEGRGTALESRTLNEFGEWICRRADGYQDILSIVADQRNNASARPVGATFKPQNPARTGSMQQQQGRTHVTGQTAAGKQNPPNDQPPFCFKCEKDHNLENCDDFKKLSTEDRTSFAIRRSLCFVYLRPKHDARNCRCRKACSIRGCPFYHHILLHNSSTAAATYTTSGLEEDATVE